MEAVNESVYLYHSQELFSALILDGVVGHSLKSTMWHATAADDHYVEKYQQPTSSW